MAAMQEKIRTGDGSRHDVAALTSLNELHDRLQELEKEMKVEITKMPDVVRADCWQRITRTSSGNL